MSSTKFIPIALLALALTSTTLSATNYDGCVYIDGGECIQCFKRKYLPNNRGCGPLLPESDKCLIYQTGSLVNSDICGYCKTGYSLKYNFEKGKSTLKCVPATLPNCLLESQYETDGQTQTTCEACPDNQYSFLNKNTQVSVCKKFSKPDPNCKWGSVFMPEVNRGVLQMQRGVRCQLRDQAVRKARRPRMLVPGWWTVYGL